MTDHTTNLAVPEGLVLRPLQLQDYHKGYLDLLAQLTTVGEVSFSEFQGRFEELASQLDDNATLVLEDLSSSRVVAAGTLVVVRKYIHHCSKAGYLEEIVVDQRQRGRHLGQLITEHLVKLAHQKGCYKVLLVCFESNAAFYRKCGFEDRGTYMAKYL